MKQSKPLRRKESLRDAYIRKLRAEGKPREKWLAGAQKLVRRKPLKKIGRSQRAKLKTYFAIRNEYLARPENRDCLICTRLRERGDAIPMREATEIHHIRGRGAFLCDERFFAACCRGHRDFPHEHPREARALGLLL